MRKALAAILAAVLLVGSVCAGLWLAGFYREGQEQGTKMEALRRLAASPIVTDIGQGPQETPLPGNRQKEWEAPTMQHDFTALQAENPDCIGWISIPGTEVDFPIMQSQDKPEFYLDHDFSREYDIYGLPFLDARCSLDSGNLLVYGHHMNDGSMFSCLHKYQDKEFWQAHQEVVFETPAGVESYRIAAVLRVKGSYKAGEWSVFRCLDVDNQAAQEIAARRLYDTDVRIGPGDKLLTLVTCEYSQVNGRLAVIAVKE